jgi:preprotein translocase subunit SecD
VVSVLVVLVVVAVVLRTGSGSTPSGSAPGGGTTITLSARPTPQVPRITASAMSREVALIRRRLASLGHGFSVTRSGATDIVVTVPKARAAERARITRLIAQIAQLRFYDWEADVLTSNGKTAASRLLVQDPAALSVSQGGGSGPGLPGAGSMSLYDAVKLAAKQPRAPASPFQSSRGSEYYLFGAPGSKACATTAVAVRAGPVAGAHCLLAGPLDTSGSRERALQELGAELAAGVSASQGEALVVPQGTVVLEAQQSNEGAPADFSDPTAQFFVLRDHVALPGNEITHPTAGLDQTGTPDVKFGFTGDGQSAFEKVTGQIARRGAHVSTGGEQLDQHFAVALDGRLITVPQINFRQYPDGVVGAGTADITGGFTLQSARDVATELRYGALPLALLVVP